MFFIYIYIFFLDVFFSYYTIGNFFLALIINLTKFE